MTTTSIIPFADGWDTVPQDGGGLIRGKIIKFREGEFVLDKQATINGAKLAVMGVTVVWVRWAEGKPQEHRITKPGERHPDRDELGGDDETRWETGLDGERTDPWHNTRYLYLVNRQTAEEATFVTDIIGGRRALADLKGQIANMREAYPTAIPIVELASEKMKTCFGPRIKPHFKVIEWLPGRGDSKPLQIEAKEPAYASLTTTFHSKGAASAGAHCRAVSHDPANRTTPSTSQRRV